MVKQLNTLVSLLEDSDKEVVSAVTDEILKKGVDVLPNLEKAWERALSKTLQDRLEAIIFRIQFQNTRDNLKNWIEYGAENLLEGAFYVAQFQYPNIKLINLEAEIRKISDDIYLSHNQHLSAIEKVRLLNYVLYDLNNFSRNTANFYSPQNSFINKVIDARKGNPISLGIIYLTVAQIVGLPVYGVNLPKSFILAYINEYRHNNSEKIEEDILFYINPYNKGALLNKREIDYFLSQQNIRPLSEHYVPCDNKSIIIRLLTNLIIAYKKLGFEDKTHLLQTILSEIEQEQKHN